MRLVRVAALLVLLQLAFLAVVVLGAAVPASQVLPQLRSAVAAGELAEDYPPDGVGGQLDGFTECLALSVGLDAEGPLVERALHAPYAAGCGHLHAWLAGQPDAATGLYFRYWHGYTALTRPALALGGITAVRLLTVAMLAAGVVLLARVVSRSSGPLGAALLLLPLAVTTNVLLTPLATTQGISTAVALLGAAATVEAARRASRMSTAVVAMCAGAAFVFVDLLTTPPLAWMLVTAAVTATVWERTRGVGPAAAWGATAAGTWVLGYAGTWLSKWLLTALTLSPARVFHDVLAVARFRTGGHPEAGLDRVLGQATFTNLRYWLEQLFPARVVAAGILALVVTATVAALVRRRPRALAVGALVGAPALAAPLWFELMSNHSLIHTFFTYRNVAASAGIAAFAALTALRLALGEDVSSGARPAAHGPG